MVAVVILISIAIFVLLLWRERLFKSMIELALCALILAMLIAIRLQFFTYATLDYKDFLAKWVEFYRLRDGFSALKYSIGNYNVPYLYFLALFSYIPVYDLYLIKLLSVIFDLVLAFSGMKLVSLFTESRLKKLFSFYLILLLPTVILNGSCWAQCDSIYASFAILSVYNIFKGRPVLSMVLLALSFGFKLQAIFIMPVFITFLFTKKLRLRQIFIFPLTYVLMVLPAVLAGRPFLDTLTLYFNQIGSVGSGLNYNSPSVFAFYRISFLPMAAKLGVAAAFMFILIISLILFINRSKINDKVIFNVTLLFSIALPFFLPHMHERYFFIADILSLCYAIIYLKRWPLPLLVSFASLLGYYAYLKMVYFLPMSFGALALIIVMLFLISDLNILLTGTPKHFAAKE